MDYKLKQKIIFYLFIYYELDLHLTITKAHTIEKDITKHMNKLDLRGYLFYHYILFNYHTGKLQ